MSCCLPLLCRTVFSFFSVYSPQKGSTVFLNQVETSVNMLHCLQAGLVPGVNASQTHSSASQSSQQTSTALGFLLSSSLGAILLLLARLGAP